MKILVRVLRDSVPKEVHETYDAKKLDLEFVDLTYLEGVRLNGTIEKFQDTLTFRGRLTSRIEQTCARCVKSVEEAIDQPFEVIYDIKGRDEVDTLEDIREILILNHPERFLCREECSGLCPQCGTDLNVSSCPHNKITN